MNACEGRPPAVRDHGGTARAGEKGAASRYARAPMAQRHPILYELDRWRRYRWWLLWGATIATLTGIFVSIRFPQQLQTANTWLLVAACCWAFASSLWVRQRFSYVALDGDRLQVRMLGGRTTLEASAIRRVRVIRTAAAFERPERRRFRPRPDRRWSQTETLVIRLKQAPPDRLRRLLGRRCVFDDEIVLPVDDAAGLGHELERLVAPAAAPATARPAKKRRRR